MNEKGLLKRLLELWPFITSLVIVTIAFANLSSANSTMASRLTRLEEHQSVMDIAQSSITAQLSQIQTDLQWIKLRLK